MNAINPAPFIQTAPVISVITAVYNGQEHLQQCIESVIGQRYPHIQYIVIDGGSTDGTTGIIRKYENRLHYWVSEKDAGVYDAWNKGIAKATGDWVVFLGADDYLWDDKVIANVLPYLQQAASLGNRYLYGKINLLSKSGSIVSVLGAPWKDTRKDIFHHMSLVHCGSFHHKSLFEEHGQFNTSFRIAGDYEFLLREFTKNREAFFCDLVLAGMRIGGLSASLRLKLRLARENILALQLNKLPVRVSHRLQILKATVAIFFLKVLSEESVSRITDLIRTLTGKEKRWTTTK